MNKNIPLLLIYNASAGSGKTTTLIREILKIIIEGESGQFELRKIRQILGLTFTNAVANELKKRLVSVLFEIAKGDESQFEKLKKIYFNDCSMDDDTIRQRAEDLLYHLLHNYSDVSLSTIDSFSNRVLKSFAYDLNYSLVYNIATNTEDYYNKTIERFLDELETTNNQRFQWIMEFVRNRIEIDENYSIRKFIQEIINIIKPLTEKEISNEELQTLKERLNKIDEKKLKDAYSDSKNCITPRIQEFEEEIRKKIEEVGKKNNWYECDRNRLEIKNTYDKIKVKGIENLNKVYKEPFFSFEILNNAEDFFYKRPKDYVENQRQKDVEEINKIYHLGKQLGYETIKRDADSLHLFQQLLSRLLITRLAIELQDVLSTIKREEDILFFSDFTREINKVIQNEKSVDFIFEKIGTRYRHFLIDEFQDTSTMQFNNLLPLIHNAMAEGHTNYIVGDPKQSIYMWRNANVHQFINLAQHKHIDLERLQRDWERFKSHIESKSLQYNFRSAKNIVEFNNAVFNNLNYGDLNLIGRVYKDAEQWACSAKQGYVEIIEYDCKTLKNKEQRQKEFINDVLEKINECIELGYQQKDICILLRTKSEIASLINELSSQKLNNGEILQFIAPEGLTIFQNEEVDFIIAFLRVLLNPYDKIANAVCWNYYLKQSKNLSGDFYYDEKLSEIFIYQFNEDPAFKDIHFNLSKMDVYQLCLNIIEFFKIPFHSYVQKLLNIVSLYVHQYASQGNTLDDFLDFWENNKRKFTIQVGQDLNAVKVYTIHKSKGLEFPVVITNLNFNSNVKSNHYWCSLPDNFTISWKYNDKNIFVNDFQNLTMYLPFETIQLLDADFARHKSEEAHLENINLIYVALTRAVNRLYVFGEINNRYDDCKYYEYIVKPKIKNLFREKPMRNLNTDNDKQQEGSSKKVFYYGVYEERPNIQTRSSDTISIVEEKLVYNPNVLLSDDANPYSDEIGMGIKVHKLLEFVNDNAIEKPLKKAIAKGLINFDELKHFEAIFQQLVDHSELKQYFDPNNIQYVLNELEVISGEEEVYRPDKIIFTKQNEIIVLEFKTGLHSSKHQLQLSKYVGIIQSLYQSKNVMGYLIYLKDNSLECKKVEVTN